MEQRKYVDLIDRLINKELRFEALAAHEQYQFLEAARERCLHEDWESLNEDVETLEGE